MLVDRQVLRARGQEGASEDRLLRESVDLVVSHPAYLKHIHEVAPRRPALVYTNSSNLYEDLLTDWLS